MTSVSPPLSFTANRKPNNSFLRGTVVISKKLQILPLVTKKIKQNLTFDL